MQDTPTRVVVTGAGIVSSIGSGYQQFWDNCLEGYSSVSPIPEKWKAYAEYHSSIWATLDPLSVNDMDFRRTEIAQSDPVSLIACYATSQALSTANLSVELVNKRANTFQIKDIDSQNLGVYMGTGIGGYCSLLENHSEQLVARQHAKLQQVYEELPENSNARVTLHSVLENLNHSKRFNPFAISMSMPNSVSARIGLKYSIKGPNLSYCLACASGTVAIGKAFHAIRNGEISAAISGGSEYLNDPYGGSFRGFDVAGALVRECSNPDTSNRPFDNNRSGFLFSQGGAAVLMLESLEHATQRGAPIIGEIAGYAETFDAHSIMSVAPDGIEIERMINNALNDASLTTQDIDYINAHGTGTQTNDKAEAEIIDRIFGNEVLINATKSLTGHTIGAAGAIEALVTVLSLKEQKTHACKNLEDPILNLNFAKEVTAAPMEAALSQSFAFGGHNAGLIFKRYH